MGKEIFKPAIEKMLEIENRFYGPCSFLDYLDENDFSRVQTAQYISVDFYHKLNNYLAQNDIMVFRLGASPKGRGTQFLLVKAVDNLGDFFLEPINNYSEQKPVVYRTPVLEEKLLGFKVMPKLSETSLVNLALASGLLSEALKLDCSGPLLPPATGASTFTFKFKPHSSFNQIFIHRRGQVEVDTLFGERRNGKKTLFVIEAKTGDPGRRIAKHKLVYPILAIKEQVPDDIEIIPVYMNIDVGNEKINYQIAECVFKTTGDVPPLNNLVIKETRSYYLEI